MSSVVGRRRGVLLALLVLLGVSPVLSPLGAAGLARAAQAGRRGGVSNFRHPCKNPIRP